MKLPVRCPFCNDVMLTTFSGDFIIVKVCEKRITHYIEFRADTETNDIDRIIIRISRVPLRYANWNYSDNEGISFWVDTRNESPTFLPFFEPDLRNFSALISKIKTYILFS